MSFIRAIIVYLLDIISVLLSWLIQYPTARYSRRFESPQDNFESVLGKLGLVVEEVTRENGLVRYSGTNWNAKLADDENLKVIEIGKEVIIQQTIGNSLIVRVKNEE